LIGKQASIARKHLSTMSITGKHEESGSTDLLNRKTTVSHGSPRSDWRASIFGISVELARSRCKKVALLMGAGVDIDVEGSGKV
jgi:hypothetical protein